MQQQISRLLKTILPKHFQLQRKVVTFNITQSFCANMYSGNNKKLEHAVILFIFYSLLKKHFHPTIKPEKLLNFHKNIFAVSNDNYMRTNALFKFMSN